MSLTSTITLILSVGSLIALAFGAYLIIRHRLSPRTATWLVFGGSLIAALGSLYYSEIAGFEPCRLCWFQRIFMYPIVLIAGIGLLRHRNISDYVIALSVPGALIAAYHWGLQMVATFASVSDTCSATGVSCITAEFMTFGFISIPFLSLSMFLTLIVLGWIIRHHHE